MGGRVSVFKVVDGKKGDLIATATTADDGTYSADIGDYSGTVLIEVVGGSYKDEATGKMVPLEIPLRAALPKAQGEVTAVVTPLTELAVVVAEKAGFDDKAIRAANDSFSQFLEGKSIVETLPRDLMSDEAAEGDDAYGLLLAGISGLAENEGLEKALSLLTEELKDGKLDDLAVVLKQEMSDFVTSDMNKAGLSDIPQGLEDAIDEIASTGFTPTGDLKDLKELLIDLVGADPDDPGSDFKVKFDAFLTYMDTFVAESPEAHLYKAAALMADLYNDEGLKYLKDLGIDLDMNPNAFLSDPQNMMALSDQMLKVTLDGTAIGLKQTLSLLASKIDLVVGELTKAEGASMCVSITGLDMVCMDAVDLDLMRGALMTVKAFCLFVDTVDLAVTTWDISFNGSTQDVRTIDMDLLSETEKGQVKAFFLEANPSLFTYVDARAGLVPFKVVWDEAAAFFTQAILTLDNMGEEGRKNRMNHALTFDSELEFYTLKGMVDEVLPSVDIAWTTEGVREVTILFEKDSVPSVDVYIAEDGYAYVREFSDIFIQVREAENEMTLYNLLNKDGGKTLKDCLATPPSYAQNQGLPRVIYPKRSDVNWDEPIDVISVPTVEGLAIDGQSDDWASVAPIYQHTEDGVKVAFKLARNSTGMLCMSIGGQSSGYDRFSAGVGLFDVAFGWGYSRNAYVTHYPTGDTLEPKMFSGDEGYCTESGCSSSAMILGTSFRDAQGVVSGGEFALSQECSEFMMGPNTVGWFSSYLGFMSDGTEIFGGRQITLVPAE